MTESFYRLIYTLLPCLVGAYAVAVFLTTRPISAARAWVLGFVIAAVLTLGVVTTVGSDLRYLTSERRLLIDFLYVFGSLYFIPMIVLVPTALALRARKASRGSGIVVLVALFLASAWIGRVVSARFNLVNVVSVTFNE